jgi:hypothetical protein
MKKYAGHLSLVFFLLFVFIGCQSTRLSGRKTLESQQALTIRKCDQTIRYYSEKIKGSKTGQEIMAHTEIVISPSSKLINLKSEAPNEEKADFNTVIETFDCDFNSDLTEGQAVYHGYIKQENGTTTKTTIRIEAKDGGIIIIGSDPGHTDADQMVIVVSKWEVVQE